MTIPRRSITFSAQNNSKELLEREWLVTNGLGGYASGTLSGIPTRRYHGLLVAAYPTPQGRVLVFNRMTENIAIGEQNFSLSSTSYADSPDSSSTYLKTFTLIDGLPVWSYQFKTFFLEKRIFMPYQKNTVHITYRVLQTDQAVRLELRPFLHFRLHNDPVDHIVNRPQIVRCDKKLIEVVGEDPDVRLFLFLNGQGCFFSESFLQSGGICYRIEQERGYECFGEDWSPGTFTFDITPGNCAAVTASTESNETSKDHEWPQSLIKERRRRRSLRTLAGKKACDSIAAELVVAADQFIITPPKRKASDTSGENRRVIAGYHWFGDWGRDTMISLEGLALTTGRTEEAGIILRTYLKHLNEGLIPNMFPEGADEGTYNTADATLWFFHALDRYVQLSGDEEIVKTNLPLLCQIIEKHRGGTWFGIGEDPSDGLLRQGAEEFQLTWMDAKVGDWVVTPRRGKAVEINALWYNALRILQKWCAKHSEARFASMLEELSLSVFHSFNQRFWYETGGYLYDVVDGADGADSSFRPNQLFAISLSHPVLDRSRWLNVVGKVQEKLLTPAGLRTLAQDHENYQKRYFGNLLARDAAYHQGTVWPWLIGPFIDAWLKVHPDKLVEARGFLSGLVALLDEQCVGTIGEISLCANMRETFTPQYITVGRGRF